MSASHRVSRTLALSLAPIVLGASLGASSTVASSRASAATASPVRRPVGGDRLGGPGVIVNLRPGVPPPPAMPGASFMIADLDTGQILASRAPHAHHAPASTLKMLTALTLIPRLGINMLVVANAQDARAKGSHLGILPGTAYSVGVLLQGMLTMSGNDAAYALARSNHNVATTLAEMNATAAHLGALDTRAKDPSGLDRVGQTSSAYDLALIGRAAMKFPSFRRYVLLRRASLYGGKTVAGKRSPDLKISSHNKLLYNYRGAIGIKTGYTIAAKFSFVGAATRGGRTYLVTQMASPTSSWRPAAAMLDWAFAHGPSLTPVGRLVEPGEMAASTAPPARPTPSSSSSSPPAAGRTLQAGPLPGSAHQPDLPAWTGLAAGIGALALVGAWSGRQISRRRRRANDRSVSP